MASICARAMLLLALSAVPFVSMAAEQDDPAKDIEVRIEQARAQLDGAARKLADLHSRMWEMETTGPNADRPILGILLEDSGSEDGLALGGVTPDGGAEQAGLKAGDTIVSVNGVRLDGGGESKALPALNRAMAAVKAGDSVSVSYLRDGETRTTTLVTQPRGKYMAQVMEEKGPWLQSLRTLQDLDDMEALEGLEELQVFDDSDGVKLGEDLLKAPAGLRLYQLDGDLAGYFGVDQGVLVLQVPQRLSTIRAGDVLLEVDGKAVTGSSAALQQLAALHGEVALEIKRRGRDEQVTLNADALNAKQSLHVSGGDRKVRIHPSGDGKTALLEIVLGDH